MRIRMHCICHSWGHENAIFPSRICSLSTSALQASPPPTLSSTPHQDKTAAPRHAPSHDICNPRRGSQLPLPSTPPQHLKPLLCNPPPGWLASASPLIINAVNSPPSPPHPHVSNRLPGGGGFSAPLLRSCPSYVAGLLRTETGRRQHKATGEANDRNGLGPSTQLAALADERGLRGKVSPFAPPMALVLCSSLFVWPPLTPLKISIAPYLCLPQRPPAISRVNALANPIQPDVRVPRYICRLHHDLLRTEPNRAVSVARYFRRPP